VTPPPAAVGALDSRRVASVDEAGRVTPGVGSWRLDWWVGADDRWHVPAQETAVRQSRVDSMPVVQTALRVPGGDAIARAYGVGGPLDLVVFEVENASPAPFALALVLGAAPGRRLRSVRARDRIVQVNGRPALVMPRPPPRWVATADTTALVAVRDGNAREGRLERARDWRGRLEVALLYPVAHRTRLRAAAVNTRLRRGAPPVDLTALPDADAVARGWRAHLQRGARVELPDAVWQASFDSDRASALLERGDDATPVPEALVHEEAGGWVSLLPGFPEAWRGAPLAVHDAPTGQGRISFALRWHGDRPALLWECERAGVPLRAPALDPNWSTTDQRGETLLRVSALQTQGDDLSGP
jgi:hypothetical protein